MAERRTKAAVGFRTHTGWAAAVCVAYAYGSWKVLDRRRIALNDASIPFEPYHAARSRSPEDAESLLLSAAETARRLASDAVSAIRSDISELGYTLVAGGVVLSSGRPDFTLPQALSSHAATHNAEGWLYRHALLQAGQAARLRMSGVLERDAYAEAAAAAGVPPEVLRQQLDGSARSLGPPWAQDQKSAAAAACLALARYAPRP